VTLDVAASIGIAVSPGHGTDCDALLRHADTGMYLAKNSGTGFATYSPEAENARPKQRPLLDSLRAAVADPSQLVVLYEPKANVRTGVVHGAEALLRWEHPAHGLLPAAEFMPLAERSGVVIALTDHVIDRVLQDIHEWGAGGLQLGVSVNVSAGCLLDASFPERLTALLDKHGVEAGMLEIEFTETILADVERAAAVLTELDRLGVRLALEGFGSGLSSLGYLTRFPLHQLKIDPSLMTSMVEGSTAAAVVRSCIALGRNLGLGVVADGVQTAGVWHQLASFGCELGQGPYLAEPMPAGELPTWMRERARAARLAKTPRRNAPIFAESPQ
jgi:predicted signal transduction protein with EAL and GGDEF domain